MDVLCESLPADVGVRRSSKIMEKPFDDHVMIIDLGDDVEDEGMGLTSCQEKVHGMQTEVDEKEGLGLVGTPSNPISLWPIFEKNVAKKVEEAGGSSKVIGLVGSNDDKDDPFAIGTDENAFWHKVIALDPSERGIMDCSTVNARSQQADFIDLSSSESGDDGDDDMNIAEEQEEISTTLSREDAALLAEVMKVIREGGDLRKFKVDSLKAYLRHHGLRMVGLKAELVSRIQEHLRINGRAEELYPRSSFSIDCKGDVCLGDTVLFQQAVYDTPFDIEGRCASGPPLGQRWVAGRVVNESYGAGKQQHTFTIEVYWSKGTKPFYVMRPLKIKGRNLYRMITLRQPWPNEAERQKVLDEKHARGAEARAFRAAMKSLKSKGSKSRRDARVHPYLRSHTMEPRSIHTENTVHQGSVPAPPAAPARTPSMQHGAYTERTGDTETHLVPESALPRGRNFHSQQACYEGHGQAHHVPLRIHVQESFQHGRFHIQRQVYQGGTPLQNPTYPNHGRQQGPETIPCSNAGCEKLGARKCISRSCASCCSRNRTRGRCPRHP